VKHFQGRNEESDWESILLPCQADGSKCAAYEVEGEETGGEHEEEEEDNGEGNFGVEEEHLGRWKIRTTKNVK
jgi:hypothetical protein